MPRGPFDREIKDPEAKDDHARKRRDEFLKKRYPGGNPAESSDGDKKKSDKKPAGKNTVDRKSGDKR